MTFVDTSAIYAMADWADPQHERAKNRFRALLDAGEGILTHNYVLVESMALIQHRLGVTAALKFARESAAFEIEWVDQTIHDEAVGRLASSKRRHTSLVDQVSFVVMRARGIEMGLAFDRDFVEQGFRLYEG